MEHIIKSKIKYWAEKYNTQDFISSDPVRFPHRYKNVEDIEISAFLTAWISYGNRKAIIVKAEELDNLFEKDPFGFIMHKEYELFREDKRSFYRFYKYTDLYSICERLHFCYNNHLTLQQAVKSSSYTNPIHKIQDVFDDIKGIPNLQGGSACKRLSMFLRWMVRRDKIVDLGLWDEFHPCDLIIPLDTHVHQMALNLGITKRKIADMKTAEEITDYLKKIFPDDPCLGDFSLFGFGVTRGKM